jgi:hypothetical protein
MAHEGNARLSKWPVQTRLQYARSGEEISFEELTKDLYSGVWPALLVGTPAGQAWTIAQAALLPFPLSEPCLVVGVGAAFFGTKDWLKGVAKRELGSQYRELATIGAVFLANIPYCEHRGCMRSSAV